MSVSPSPADLGGERIAADGLVEKERELTRLLIAYDELETAWPRCRHILVRAKAGRQFADMLLRIDDLQNDIATTTARTVAEDNETGTPFV